MLPLRQAIAALGRIRSGENRALIVHAAFSCQPDGMRNESIRPENESVLAIWRVGLVAYRDAMRRELHVARCSEAGTAAMMAAFPEMTREEASQHITHAVYWASVHHHAWLWRGVPRREWIWPPDHRGVGHQRNPGYEDVM